MLLNALLEVDQFEYQLTTMTTSSTTCGQDPVIIGVSRRGYDSTPRSDWNSRQRSDSTEWRESIVFLFIWFAAAKASYKWILHVGMRHRRRSPFAPVCDGCETSSNGITFAAFVIEGTFFKSGAAAYVRGTK